MGLGHTLDDKFDDLLRRAELTSKARYECSRRFEDHEIWSQWTLAALVVGHLAIALILALELDVPLDHKAVHFSAVIFGVVVLTYSLLLGLGRYGVRAKEMHLCGLELGRIARTLHGLRATLGATDLAYTERLNAYYDCLAKYENHSEADYARAAYAYLGKTGNEDMTREERAGFKRSYCVRHLLEFSHYVLSILLVWGWVLYLLWPMTRHCGAV